MVCKKQAFLIAVLHLAERLIIKIASALHTCNSAYKRRFFGGVKAQVKLVLCILPAPQKPPSKPHMGSSS